VLRIVEETENNDGWLRARSRRDAAVADDLDPPERGQRRFRTDVLRVSIRNRFGGGSIVRRVNN